MSVPFLNSLSTEEACNVLRFVSARPHAKNWKKYLSVDEAKLFICGKDAVSDISRRSLPAISTCASYYGNDGSNTAHFSNIADANQLEMFLRVASQHVVTLEIQGFPLLAHMPRMQLFVSSLLTSLKEPRVCRQPEVGNALGDFLKRLPGQLKSLCIGYQPHQEELNDIARYCKRLAKLEMEHVDLNVE